MREERSGSSQGTERWQPWQRVLGQGLGPYGPAAVWVAEAHLPAALLGTAADGSARATGKPAVVLADSAVQLVALLPALVTADADSVPLVVLVRSGPLAALESGRHRPGVLADILRLTEPVVGWNTRVDRWEELPLFLEAAFSDLRRRRPRPLLLELADEALPSSGPNGDDGLPGGAGARPPAAMPGPAGEWGEPEPEAGEGLPVVPGPGAGWERANGPAPPDRDWVNQVAAALLRARRPAIVAGGGAVGAGPALMGLAERLGAPVFLTLAARGLLPADHPLSFAGLHRPEVRRWLQEADVVLVVGTTLAPAEHGQLELSGRVIHVDLDVERLGRHVPVWKALGGDAGTVLAALERQVAEEMGRPAGPEVFLGALSPERRRQEVAALRQRLDRAEVWTAGLDARLTAADHGALTWPEAEGLPVAGPRTLLMPVGTAGPGWALPAAWGASRATGRPVRAIVSPAGLWSAGPVLKAALRDGVALEVLVRLDGDGGVDSATRARWRRLAEAWDLQWDEPGTAAGGPPCVRIRTPAAAEAGAGPTGAR